jgi:hypothetical protein
MTFNPGDFWKRGTTGNVSGSAVPEFPQALQDGRGLLDPEPCYGSWNNPKRPKPRLALTFACQTWLNMTSIILTGKPAEFSGCVPRFCEL